MVKLSVVIITRNEEHHIGRCLDSLKAVADEIIVVDSFSTDQTEAICRAHGVIFKQRTWEGYASTKNWGNDQATGDWIFSIDADEALDETAGKALLQWKATNPSPAVYQLKRKNMYGSRWVRYCGWYPDNKPRLFPKHKANWAGDFVHETLTHELDVLQLPGHLVHYTVANDAAHKAVVTKYAKLAAQREVERGRRLNPIQAGLSAFAQFIRVYVVKLGFLHGLLGFRIAFRSAQSKWLRYVHYKALLR